MTLLAVDKKQETETTYQLITSKCKTHGAEDSIVYGVIVTRCADDFSKIEDISAKREEVEQFLFRLKNGQVTPDQLAYIAQDYVVELSTR